MFVFDLFFFKSVNILRDYIPFFCINADILIHICVFMTGLPMKHRNK